MEIIRYQALKTNKLIKQGEGETGHLMRENNISYQVRGNEQAI